MKEQKEVKNPVGRPTIYSKKLADDIIEVITSNPVSVATLRELYPWFPEETTIHRWKREKKEFNKRYVRAKKQQARLHIEETIKIPDDVVGELERCDPRVANAIVQAAKLRCDTRQWYAARLLPHEFAESKKVDANINAKIKTEKTKVDLSLLTTEEIKTWKVLQEKAKKKDDIAKPKRT